MIQVEKIIKVINSDATGRWRLCDPEGRMCVMGGLLYAAGFTKEELKPWCGVPDHWYGLLFKEYGLPANSIGRLEATNDIRSHIKPRREALKELVRQLAAEEKIIS